MSVYDTHAAKPDTGVLYVVATPIGNLEDMTVRAIRILKEVSCIASEDTRHTRKLLSHFQIQTPLVSYYREKEVQQSEKIIKVLLEGNDIALVSDAGVPCISDPGYTLVRSAQEHGLRVVTIPGPSAVTSAISISGQKADNFTFLGFLPAKKNERLKKLQEVARFTSLLVFYESPHRLLQSLEDCLAILGDRRVSLCRELTKIYEQCLSGTLSEILECLTEQRARGEYVLLVEGAVEHCVPVDPNDLTALLVWYRDNSGLSLKDAVSKVSGDIGISRSKVYSEALRVWKEGA